MGRRRKGTAGKDLEEMLERDGRQGP